VHALTHRPRRALAFGVAIAIALIALLPGAWGTALGQTAGAPPPPAVVTVTVVVDGTSTQVITTPGGLASIILPPGSQITSVSLTVTTSPAAVSSEAAASTQAVTNFIEELGGAAWILGNLSTVNFAGSNIQVGYVFAVSFDSAASALGVGPQLVMNGGALAQLQLSQEAFQTAELAVAAVGTLNVLPETLAQVGGDLSRLIVVYVDPANNVVEAVTMLPSPGPGVLAFEFTKAGSYAVIVAALTPEELADVPAAPSPADTGMGDTESGATNTLAIILSVVALAGILGAGSLAVSRRRA